MHNHKALRSLLKRVGDLQEEYVRRERDDDQITLEIDYATEARDIFKELIPALEEAVKIQEITIEVCKNMGKVLSKADYSL